MLRAILALALGLLLSGCWASEKQFFDSGDWANLELDGKYLLETAGEGNGGRLVTVTTMPDGLVAIVPDRPADADEARLLGLVAIPGGSGRFFLADDRTFGGEGYLYFVVHLTANGGLAIYAPDCVGTPWAEGIVVEEEGKGGTVCTFGSEEALMRSALEAERFLSRPHIVKVSPFQALSRMEEPPEEEAEGDGDEAS